MKKKLVMKTTAKNHLDKRIEKTEDAIFVALLDIMAENEGSKITVTQLCERANINKSTFYLHYKSIQDCQLSCRKEIIAGIEEFATKMTFEEIRKNPKVFISPLLDEIEVRYNYLCIMKHNKSVQHYAHLIKTHIIDTMIEYNPFTYDKNIKEIIYITFAVGGCVDAILEPLPNFNKKALECALCDILKNRKVGKKSTSKLSE